MNPIIVLSTCILYTYGASIDADVFADLLIKKGFNQDSRIQAANGKTSPAAAAALAYMKDVFSDDLCGIPAQVYVENILNGKSKEVAAAAASKFYINAYNKGVRLVPGSACETADLAWREAFVAGKDPILESAKVFITNWPGLSDGNPCAVAGFNYLDTILTGKTNLEAGRSALIGYVNAFKDMAGRGLPLKDEACKEATKAFIAAIPDSNNLDPERAIAFNSFMNKIFEDDAPAYDPVCLRALEGYLDSYIAGDDLQTRNIKAALAFFEEFNKGSDIPADSPCAAATLSYAQTVKNNPSQPSAAGMIAYITEAIKTGRRKVDPACAAATSAYLEAFIEKKDEALASEAAGVAYLEALDKFPETDETSACAMATKAYIAEFDEKLRR